MATHDASESSTAKAGQAPAPDDSRKPDSPKDLVKPNWKYIAKKTFREFNKDQCPDQAAALTYFAVLSLFPAILALISVIGLFGDPQKTTSALLQIVSGFAPAETVNTVSGTVEELASAPAAGLTLVLGLATALWSASGYVGAFGRAMNRVYEVDEGRPFVKLRGTMLVVTALGGVIVMLLWLWIRNMSLLFGAEFDAEMERGRQLQAGIKAEETIQLPPRDTKKSEKLQKQEEEDIRHGRELREKYSAENGRDDSSDGGRDQDGTRDSEQPTEPHRDRVRDKVRDRAVGGDDARGGNDPR